MLGRTNKQRALEPKRTEQSRRLWASCLERKQMMTTLMRVREVRGRRMGGVGGWGRVMCVGRILFRVPAQRLSLLAVTSLSRAERDGPSPAPRSGQKGLAVAVVDVGGLRRLGAEHPNVLGRSTLARPARKGGGRSTPYHPSSCRMALTVCSRACPAAVGPPTGIHFHPKSSCKRARLTQSFQRSSLEPAY